MQQPLLQSQVAARRAQSASSGKVRRKATGRRRGGEEEGTRRTTEFWLDISRSRLAGAGRMLAWFREINVVSRKDQVRKWANCGWNWKGERSLARCGADLKRGRPHRVARDQPLASRPWRAWEWDLSALLPVALPKWPFALDLIHGLMLCNHT
jgi:hypothetical protein